MADGQMDIEPQNESGMEEFHDAAGDHADMQQEEQQQAVPDDPNEATATIPAVLPAAFSTPGKAMAASTDYSKTISRPAAKTRTPLVDISPIRPDTVQAEEETAQEAAATTSTALNTTLNLSDNRSKSRPRQQTVVMESQMASEIKKVFEEKKAAAGESKELLEDIERRILVIAQNKERAFNARLMKVSEELTGRETETDALAAKHIILEQEKMLRELLNGDFIHVSQIPNARSDENAKRVSAERDALKKELDNWHADYSKVFDMYTKTRKIVDIQVEEYSQLDAKHQKLVKDYKQVTEKFMRYREKANEELERASRDMDNCEAASEEKTLGLRMKVRQLEANLQAKEQELDIKRKELMEVKDICNQLMSQVEPGSDQE